jgi:putative membrane protein insertion efficiency factor
MGSSLGLDHAPPKKGDSASARHIDASVLENERNNLYSMLSRNHPADDVISHCAMRKCLLKLPAAGRMPMTLPTDIAGLAPIDHNTMCFPSTSCYMAFDVRASVMPDATSKSRPPQRNGVAVALARALIAGYRLTLSPVIGYNCRHLPTCSQYADEAIARHGFWAGGWMTLARLLRCQPFGTSGLDFVPATPPARARWYLPWRYGRWRGVNDCPH